jgi:hypothetical protein
VIKTADSDSYTLKTDGAVALGAPPSAPANLNNSQISFWLDERANQLKICVRYSDGTVKSAAIPLT